jgi:LEA14-like dessication related protein
MNTAQNMQCWIGARTILLVCFSIALVGMTGCNKSSAPTFSAVGVRQLEDDGNRTIIQFSIEAKNPNKEPIPLKQISYRVEMNGTEVFRGVRSPETTLHTFSSHVFYLPAVLPIDSLNTSNEVEYRLIGAAQYIPPGRLSEVLFDAKVKVPEAPINIIGTINTNNSSE